MTPGLPPPPAGYTVTSGGAGLPPPPAGYRVLNDQGQTAPEGSAIGRAAGGAWDYTGGGIWGLVKGLTSLAKTGFTGTVDPNSDGMKMIHGIVQGHIDQAAQAKEAWDRGDHVEAFGHTLAAALPLLGPAAAHIADTAAGTAPVMDKYGNVIKPGQAPDIPQAIGQIIGLGGSMAAPHVVSAVRGAAGATVGADIASPSGVADAGGGGVVSSRLNPTQQAAVDYLRENNVPLNAGTVTGNKFLKGAQALAQNQPLGAGVAAQAARATEQGLTRVAGDLADQAHPTPATPESAGGAVNDALLAKISNLKIAEDEAYGDAWKGADDPQYSESVPVRTEQRPIYDAAGRETGKTESVPVMADVQMPVDVRGIKQQLGPVFESMQWMPASDQAASAGYQAAKKILNGPDFIPAPAAEQGLGGLKTMARVDNTNLRNTAQGMAAGIVPDLQGAIDQAVAKTGPDALTALQEGRATHASKMEVADVADHLRQEPVQAFNQLTWQKDTGIDFLRKIGDQAPDVLPQVGRAYVQKLFDQATQDGGFSRAQGIANQWENLGPKTKALLYPNPGLRSSLDNFFLGAKMVAENPNPSGTAVVGSLIPGGILAIQNPVMGASWLLGGYAAAKLLFSPAGVRLLTGGLKAEAPMAAALRASQILRLAGDDDVTPQPPSGGSPPNPPLPPANSGAAANADSTPATRSPALPGGSNANDSASPAGNGKGQAVSQPAGTGAGAGAATPGGTATSLPVPGSTRSYRFSYAVKELGDVQTSHNGLNFAPNEKYGLVNDRDYSRPENQAKIFNGSTASQFDPRYLISDNPDASNGPPVIDSQGNVMGGNGRGMMLQRVYANNPGGAQAYRDLLMQKAANFGLDPAQIQGMKQPVLVRQIPDEELLGDRAKQTAVTDFNTKTTAALRPAEQSVADSRRVSQATLDDLGGRLDEAGPDSTLYDVLSGSGGADVLLKMIDDGAIDRNEAAALVSKGQLTPAGKARVSQALLGRFFRDPAQIDRTAPSVRNKLERMAAPLAQVEDQPAWSLTPHIQGALDLLESAASHGSKNLDDAVGQSGLLGSQMYTPQAVTLAKALQATPPKALAQAVRAYAQDARFAREGSGLFGDPPTPAEGFEAAFGHKITGTGPHGPITASFAGDPQGALAWLRGQKTGFATGAIPHPSGDIGLPYGSKPNPVAGTKGLGVAHIDVEHPGWLDQHASEISKWPVVEEIPDKSGRIIGRVLADGKGNRAVVSLDWKGQPHPEWLLTGYERTAPASGTSVSVPKAP